MRGRFVFVVGMTLIAPSIALGADPVAGVPAPERAEQTTPAVAPTAPAVVEKPKPVERPKLVEKPKPVEKPRSAVESFRAPEDVPVKPFEPPAPAAVPADMGTARQGEAHTGYSLGCLGLSFAMLIIGIAAGFLGRHFLSRHKLGGMTVRIGTWRGIP